MFSGQFPFKIPDKFWTNSGQKPDKNWFWTNSERWKMNSFWNNFWTFSFRNLSRICLDNFLAIFRTFSGHLFFIGLLIEALQFLAQLLYIFCMELDDFW